MCDIYGHKCECCDNTVEMHIADFDYPRTDFRAWCSEHVSEAVPGSVLFYDAELNPMCAVSGPDVSWFRDTNHPNKESFLELVEGDEYRKGPSVSTIKIAELLADKKRLEFIIELAATNECVREIFGFYLSRTGIDDAMSEGVKP